MTRRTGLAVVLAISGLLLGAAPAALGASGDVPAADAVVYAVQVHPDGDATWRVQYRYRLRTHNETLAFERLRERIEANRSRYTSRFAARIRPAVAEAANETGRRMALQDVRVGANRQALAGPNETLGTVTYAFTWTGFAAVEGDSLSVGDAIGGFYLGPSTTMLLGWPDHYALAAEPVPTPTAVRDTRVRWEGETVFASDEPRIRLERTGSPSPESGDGTGADQDVGGDNGPGGGGEGGSGVSLPLILGGLVAAATLAAAGILAVRGDALETTDEEGREGQGDGHRATGEGGDAAGGGPVPPDVEPELMSPEEQVVSVLAARDGRMKQQELIDETGWTESKTSKVISDMREAGTIDAFRLGRENVISLPEEDGDD